MGQRGPLINSVSIFVAILAFSLSVTLRKFCVVSVKALPFTHNTMAIQQSMAYINNNPLNLIYLDHAEHKQTDGDAVSAGFFALPVVDLKKRAKEVVEVIVGLPKFTDEQCKRHIAEITGKDPPASGSATDLLRTMINEAQSSDKLQLLPAPLNPKGAMPNGTQMGISLVEMDDDTVLCVKVFYNKLAMTPAIAKKICHGTPQTWDYSRCSDSDAFRKAVGHMIINAPGEHWMYIVNRPKAVQRLDSLDSLDNILGSQSSGGGADRKAKCKDTAWTATPEQIKNGITYINFKAPLSNGENGQFLWILLNLRDEDSPIYGWPMTYVQKAASNRSANKSQVSKIVFFPLLLSDYNEMFMSSILPLLMPWLLTHALFICGVAGRGKTSPTELKRSICSLNL
jgi:hypothetical protein